MPSGAKKRKAAKRKKEQEQQQQLGEHPPGSPTSPTAGRPHPPRQGNGEREDDDDLTSQEGKGDESDSEFASPTSGEDIHRHLEFEAGEAQAKSRVEEKGKKEGETTVAVDTVCVMEDAENGASEQPSDPLAPRQEEVEVSKKIEAEVPVVVLDDPKDDVLIPPISDSIPLISAEVPISKLKDVGTKHLQSERGKEVSIHDYKEFDAVEAASPVELSVPVSEEVVQPSAVSVETLEVVESAANASSTTNEVKVVPLTDAANQQPVLGNEGQHTESREIAGTTEVAQPTHLQQRTSWMSCCGLFDVITGANR